MRYMVQSRRDMMVYCTLFEHSLLAGSFKALEHYFWTCGFFVGLRNSSGETSVTSKYDGQLLYIPIAATLAKYFANLFLFYVLHIMCSCK